MVKTQDKALQEAISSTKNKQVQAFVRKVFINLLLFFSLNTKSKKFHKIPVLKPCIPCPELFDNLLTAISCPSKKLALKSSHNINP
jgi:hypothetical protein